MLFNKLTEAEVNAIREYINLGIGCYSQEVSCSMDYLLRLWNSNKKYLYDKLFENGELIMKKPVEIEMDRAMMMDSMSAALYCSTSKLNEKMNSFRTEYEQWCSDWYNAALKEIEEKGAVEHNNSAWVTYHDLRELVGCNSLVDNSYFRASFTFPLKNGKKMKVERGQKPMKALAKIAEVYNIPGFEDFRIAHSQILNEKKFKGNLCLSIHPLDFLTMSDNSNGWGSCMSWEDSGDYRMGVIEMMNSENVIVAYLESSTEYLAFGNSKEYTWNSKRWRELFIIDEDFMAGIKGYPVWNIALQDEVMNWLIELANKKAIRKYDPQHVLFQADDEIEFKPDEFYEYHFHTDCMYNDFAYGSHAITFAENAPTYMDYNYSGYAECMSCGATDTWFDDDDCSVVVCHDCDVYETCADCGCHLYEGEGVEFEGYTYCQYCFESLPRCDECGEIFTHDDTRTVHVAIGHNLSEIYRSYHFELCDDCYEEAKDEGLIYVKENVRWYGDISYVLISEWGTDKFEKCFQTKYEDVKDRTWGFFEEVFWQDELDISNIVKVLSKN